MLRITPLYNFIQTGTDRLLGKKGFFIFLSGPLSVVAPRFEKAQIYYE